jgi:GYF domain 2
MRCVKLFEDLLSSDRGFADRWYVTNGERAVGPVDLDLLARGIESGKVPLDSFVRNEAWTVWRPLSDIALVTVASSSSEEPREGPQTGDGGTDAQRSKN